MIEFTYKKYKKLLVAAIENKTFIITASQYYENIRFYNLNAGFCILRHDVDRFPLKALDMAKVEADLGIQSSYYFRKNRWTFKPWIIKKIIRLGHEVGFHYENLSKTHGNFSEAEKCFKKDLEDFRKICCIKTIAMHGNPLSKYDNASLFKNKSQTLDSLGIIGDISLGISAEKYAYITDTGRSWKNEHNLRDKIVSAASLCSQGTDNVQDFIKTNHPVILSTHPERWEHTVGFKYLFSLCKDLLVNFIKVIISKL